MPTPTRYVLQLVDGRNARPFGQEIVSDQPYPVSVGDYWMFDRTNSVRIKFVSHGVWDTPTGRMYTTFVTLAAPGENLAEHQLDLEGFPDGGDPVIPWPWAKQ